MIALLVVVTVYACTFVGCNEKVSSGAKAGFFVSYGVIVGVCFLLSWLLG